ncbi:MAG: hypothetical protein R2824_06095 [Saprospiraceae bacterium]|nr:hypothetical protein [Lewinella sp.]
MGIRKKLSNDQGGGGLFSALWNLAFARKAVFEKEQQRRFMQMEIAKELKQEFDERIDAMQTQIQALTATVNTLTGESQRHRQEFRKRQEKRETKAIIKKVTTNIYQN